MLWMWMWRREGLELWVRSGTTVAVEEVKGEGVGVDKGA